MSFEVFLKWYSKQSLVSKSEVLVHVQQQVQAEGNA